MNTGFLGIGTPELILIFVIAVLVVGPEKLVEFATKLGHWVAKIRSMSDGASKEFRDALQIDDIKQAINEVTQDISDVDKELRETSGEINALGKEAVTAAQDLQKKITDAKPTINPAKPRVSPSATAQAQAPASEEAKPAGKIPQAVIDAVGAPPGYAQDGSPAPHPAADVDDETAAPVEIQETTLIEKEEDYTPVVIEDVQVAGQDDQGEEGSST